MEEKQALARERRRKMMLEDPMLRVIPKIAVPMIISSLIDSIYNLVDTLFVSQLGVHATAAVAVNDSLMHILRAVSMGFAIGASSYISRLLGAKEDKRASQVGSSTLFIGIGFSFVFGLVCLLFRSPIVDLLGVTREAKHYSMQYAFWILLAAPFTTAEMIQNQLLRSEGSTHYAMIGMVSGCKTYPVQTIETVSTVGAGDNFNAGYIYATMQGEQEETSRIGMAQRWGQDVCRQIGNNISDELVECLKTHIR